MGNCFLYGNGGSNPLNFVVVDGTTQPSNPKENMFWVNTAQKITGYYFSPTQPENVVAGNVWFRTGIASRSAFNALKKNTVMVYPVYAKQYISGAWADKPVKVYQNGKWSDLYNGELFANGNQYTDLTGGWSSEGWTVSEENFTAAGATIDDNGITCLTIAATAVPLTGTVNKIDLKEAKTIYVTVEEVDAEQVACIAVTSEKVVSGMGTMTTKADITATGEVTLDVSGIEEGYVVVFNYAYGNPDKKLRISKIRMEQGAAE